MGDALWIDISRLITPGFLAVWASLLLEFRHPEKLTSCLLFILTGALLFANGVMMVIDGGGQIYTRLWPLTLTFPFILLLMITTVRQTLQTLFTLFTVLFWGCVVATAGLLTGRALDIPWLDPAVRSVLFLAMLPLINAYKTTYRAMIKLTEKGWSILAAIPALLSCCFYLLINMDGFVPPEAMYLSAVFTALLGMCVYGFIYIFFRKLLAERIDIQYRELLACQAEELEFRARSNSETERRLSIFRHDLKHYISMISAQIEKGHPDAALIIIEDAKSRFSEVLDTGEDKK